MRVSAVRFRPKPPLYSIELSELRRTQPAAETGLGVIGPERDAPGRSVKGEFLAPARALDIAAFRHSVQIRAQDTELGDRKHSALSVLAVLGEQDRVGGKKVHRRSRPS